MYNPNPKLQVSLLYKDEGVIWFDNRLILSKMSDLS